MTTVTQVNQEVQFTDEELEIMENGITLADLAYRLKTEKVEGSSMRRSLKWLYKNQSKLNFDLAIQRNGVWDDKRCSLLIHSIMIGLPVPEALSNERPFYEGEKQTEIYEMLDGKQRIKKAIIRFLDNGYPLHKDTPDVFGFKVAGKYFNDLPEILREAIEDADIKIWKMKNLTDEMIEELFFRWNNGAPLTKMEITRVLSGSIVSNQMIELKNMEFFSDFVQLSGTQRNRFVDEELIMQIMILLTTSSFDLGGDAIRALGESKYETGFEQYDIDRVKKIAEYMFYACGGLQPSDNKAILKKANVPVLFVVAEQAMAKGISDFTFAHWMKKFLVDDHKPGSTYAGTTANGSAKPDKVKPRMEILQAEFDKFFADMEKAKEVAIKVHDDAKKKREALEAKKAAEKAKKDAEKAEKKRLADEAKAQVKAKEDAEKAEEEAKAKAEKEKADAEKAEAKRLADEEKKRKKAEEKARKDEEKRLAKEEADKAKADKAKADKQEPQPEPQQEEKKSNDGGESASA